MPRCVQCNCVISRLTHIDHGAHVVDKCPSCGLPVDKHMEHTTAQECIDVTLLHHDAWVHMVFNTSRKTTLKLALIVLITCVLEVYVSETIKSYSNCIHRIAQGGVAVTTAAMDDTPARLFSEGPGAFPGSSSPVVLGLGSATGTAVPSPTLQFIPNIHPPRLHIISFSRMPVLVLYSLLEFFFVWIAFMWSGSFLVTPNNLKEPTAQPQVPSAAPQGPKQNNATPWGKTMMLATAAKLLYVPFLVWNIPVYLTAAVDVTYALWLLQALQTLAPRSAIGPNLVVLAIGIGLRCVFRGVTRWCPFFVSTEAFYLTAVV